MADTGDTVDIKNGLLGFSNPNYHLDDAVNCNTATEEELYDDLYQELDSVCNFNRHSSAKGRRNYASLDLDSMGIDLNADPSGPNSNINNANTTTSTSAFAATNSHSFTTAATVNTNATNVCLAVKYDDEANRNTSVNSTTTGVCEGVTIDRSNSNSYLNYFMGLDSWSQTPSLRPDLIENVTSTAIGIKHTARIESPDSYGAMGMELSSPDGLDVYETIIDPLDDSQSKLNNNIFEGQPKLRPPLPGFAKPLTPNDKGSPTTSSSESSICSTSCLLDKEEILPPGWEKHEDADGPYYWHIKSGTIQREPPPPTTPNLKESEIKKPVGREPDIVTPLINNLATSPVPGHVEPVIIENIKGNTEQDTEKPIRFAVRSLGWVEIAEEDLTPERSSRAVNKCIVDLSLGRNDLLDVVGRWGDGKDLFMDLDNQSLKLVDPEKLAVLNTQPIHTIRVWGVGRDNGRERDFAYVARDRLTRKHMCHVFRCDSPARTIANTLRDICKKIMIERSLQKGLAKPSDSNSSGGSISSDNSGSGSSGLTRPTNLPTEQRRFQHRSGHSSYSAQSFPTPMEEPKKVIKVHYLGTIKVTKPTGMEVLNNAIEKLTTSVPTEKWQFVNVAVAPSTITITDPGDEGKMLTECRVRYLSFLGIGRNVKHCGFIMHTAQDLYVAHIFHCEPSSGALCKTIEAACKLRYQKCLDAHPQGSDKRQGDSQSGKGITTTLKNMIGTMQWRRNKSQDT